MDITAISSMEDPVKLLTNCSLRCLLGLREPSMIWENSSCLLIIIRCASERAKSNLQCFTRGLRILGGSEWVANYNLKGADFVKESYQNVVFNLRNCNYELTELSIYLSNILFAIDDNGRKLDLKLKKEKEGKLR